MDTLTAKRRSPRRQGQGTVSGMLSRTFLLISLALLWHTEIVAGQGISDYTTVTTVVLPPAEASESTNTTDGGNTTATDGGNITTTAAPTFTTPTIMEDATEAATTFSPTTSLPIETMPPTEMTASPTVATMAPTVKATAPLPPDTAAPSFKPTGAPTVATGAPTITTASPTISTMSPTIPEETASPTSAPSMATKSPTMTTMAPTSGPPTSMEATSAPTSSPGTEAPTTKDATLSPTTANVTQAPSAMATEAQTSAQTTTGPTVTPGEPTGSPTGVPEGELVEDTVTNLKMIFVGLNQDMGPDAINEWKIVTEEHTKDYYRRNPNLEITDVVTTVDLESTSLISVRRRGLRRSLQTTSLSATYKQTISFRTKNTNRDTAETVVLAPFLTPADLDNYLVALQSASSEFEIVDSITPVEIEGGGSTESPAISPVDDGGGLGTGAIIGIVVGCVVGVCAFLGVGYFVMQRGDDGGYVSTKTPPSQLDVNQGPDEVSTLAEPHTNNRASGLNNAMSGESIQGYGDQSVATVDYDYSKAYGGGGDTSVSSAGGTFGSQTHTQGAGGATIGSTNGNPLDAGYGGGFRGQNANVREELIDIYAPPGKLGVVIDTPDDGAPVVHAVKDSSVIADKLQVGDKLVAVDDEDVRSMTAIKVSKLISRKSANASRKLSIIRTVVVDE